MFDVTLPRVFSFHPSFDHVRQLFRENQLGGLTNVFHRQIILDDSPGPEAAKKAPNGLPFSYFSFWDFNALYLFSQDQNLPLGPGLEWILVDKTFNKKVMTPGVSFGQIQWLMWMQSQDLCLDSNNERVFIQHAYNLGYSKFYSFNYRSEIPPN